MSLSHSVLPRKPLSNPWQSRRPLDLTATRPQVKDALTQRANDFHILLDDVALTHLSFGDEVHPPPTLRAASHSHARAEAALYDLTHGRSRRRSASASVARASLCSSAASVPPPLTRTLSRGKLRSSARWRRLSQT